MEILNTYSKFNDGFNIIALFSVCGAVVFLIFTIVYLFINWKESWKWFIGAVVCVLICIGVAEIIPYTEEKFSEVIITDMNQLDIDKYQIVEKRGEIVVLKEIKTK